MCTDPDLGGGPALFALVRFWSRRWAATGHGVDHEGSRRTGRILILEAVDAARGGAERAAIAAVASELGLDRSNASRMLADAVAAGLVCKHVPPGDARRTMLGITPDGAALLADARTWQRQAFARMTAEWPPDDVTALSGYLVRLAATMHQTGDDP